MRNVTLRVAGTAAAVKAASHARFQIHLEKGVLDRTVEVHDRPVLPRILEA